MGSEYNLEIANCTTPSNFFHLLRRQIKRDFRKPLIIFTPKSLLRHPKCFSSIDDFSFGNFHHIIDDFLISKEVEKIVFCSGKIYYDLLKKREELNCKKIVLIRVELLFPLDKKTIIHLIKKYNTDKLFWVQEEPENMGAWRFILSQLRETEIKLISRKSSAATATGSSQTSLLEQEQIINKVFKEIK